MSFTISVSNCLIWICFIPLMCDSWLKLQLVLAPPWHLGSSSKRKIDYYRWNPRMDLYILLPTSPDPSQLLYRRCGFSSTALFDDFPFPYVLFRLKISYTFTKMSWKRHGKLLLPVAHHSWAYALYEIQMSKHGQLRKIEVPAQDLPISPAPMSLTSSPQTMVWRDNWRDRTNLVLSLQAGHFQRPFSSFPFPRLGQAIPLPDILRDFSAPLS